MAAVIGLILMLKIDDCFSPIKYIFKYKFNIIKIPFGFLSRNTVITKIVNNIMVFFINLKTIHSVLITHKIIIKNTIKTSNIEKHPNEVQSNIHQYEFDELKFIKLFE